MHALVVEDEFLFGDETANGLRLAGFSVTGPIGTLSKALEIVASEDIDAALLDINISGDFVWPAARVLRARATLVIAKLDRLSRNAAFLLTLRDSGVRFLACHMPEANDPTVGILALVTHREREAHEV